MGDSAAPYRGRDMIFFRGKDFCRASRYSDKALELGGEVKKHIDKKWHMQNLARECRFKSNTRGK